MSCKRASARFNASARLQLVRAHLGKLCLDTGLKTWVGFVCFRPILKYHRIEDIPDDKFCCDHPSFSFKLLNYTPKETTDKDEERVKKRNSGIFTFSRWKKNNKNKKDLGYKEHILWVLSIVWATFRTKIQAWKDTPTPKVKNKKLVCLKMPPLMENSTVLFNQNQDLI